MRRIFAAPARSQAGQADSSPRVRRFLAMQELAGLEEVATGIQERIAELQQILEAPDEAGAAGPAAILPPRQTPQEHVAALGTLPAVKRRKLSAAARERIAAAQRRRWAVLHAAAAARQKEEAASTPSKKKPKKPAKKAASRRSAAVDTSGLNAFTEQ